MGAFKELYNEQKEYINELLNDGYVLDDADLDFDNPEEELEEDENAVYTDVDVEDNGELNERLVKKIVIRRGKKIKKWFSTDKNKHIVPNPDGGKPKEVKTLSKEKINRKKGARKAKISRKSGQAQSKIKRKMSNRKRKIFGLK